MSNSTNKSSSTNKKRYWTFLLYPESAPADWREILIMKGLQFAVSPLHDKDINPTGEPKKAHYHIILYYNGPTTYNCVKSLTEELNQPIPMAIDSPIGMYRYFTHKDNPEKYQYNSNEITLYNGFDIQTCLSTTDILKCIKIIHTLINEKDITEYSTLLDYLLCTDDTDLYFTACTKSILFNTYLTSRRHSAKL